MFSVTYSEFALIGIHSKCAMVGACAEFDVKDPPENRRGWQGCIPRSTNLNVIPDPNHLTELKTTQEQETEKRGPMCFTLQPMKATAQIRSCLKEVSGSNLIREYFVGFSDNLVMRSIIILYPQYNMDKPEEILLSCQHLDLVVDSSIYVHVDECQELSAGTSLVQPTPSTQMRADDNIPTSSHGTKVPSKFSGTPRCMYVVFESCGTAADCMTTFLRYVKGEAVFLHREKKRDYYFYLFGSTLAMDDLPGRTKPEMNIRISDVNCIEFLSHHYDTSESFQFQISAWKPTSELSFSIQPLKRTNPQHIQSRDDEKRCVLAYEENIEKACLPCVQELEMEGGIEKMTGSTILLSGINDSNEAKLATCITKPNELPRCSNYNFLPLEMCEYPMPSTFKKGPERIYKPTHETVTLLETTGLDETRLKELALRHTVLLVSREQNYLWMLPDEKFDPRAEMYGKNRGKMNFDMEVRYLRAISSANMEKLIDQQIPEE